MLFTVSHSGPNRNLKTVLAVVLLVFAVYFFARKRRDELQNLTGGLGDGRLKMVGPAAEKHDKWIVVTTIQRPTKAVIQLSKIPGWKMVVVGDAKTPTDWSVPGVTYLDISKQKSLNYGITELLPYNSYCRKNIGYLYAIQNGAKMIFETDDDNAVSSEDMSLFHTNSRIVSALLADNHNLTLNPYVHFGQPTVWPRGFPLQNIGSHGNHRYLLCDTRVPVVQQGVVNGDPDVDAIYRLTRKPKMSRLNVSFDKHAAPFVVPRGTFVPYNTQNTLHLYPALWALFLPSTVTQRVTDIWRAYWAQKLMTLVNQNIGYYPSTAFQERTPHSYLNDFKQEIDLYLLSGKFISFLQKWRCSKMFLFSCISDLTRDMAKAGYLEWNEVTIIDAWLSDLSMVGYVSPPLYTAESPSCLHGSLSTVLFYACEQPTSFSHTTHPKKLPQSFRDRKVLHFVEQICGRNVPKTMVNTGNKTLEDILLVVHVRESTENILALEALYRPYFSNIVYCGQEKLHSKQATIVKLQVSYISLQSTSSSSHTCLVQAIRMNYNTRGYLYVYDGLVINPRTFGPHSLDHMWMAKNSVLVSQHTGNQCDDKSVPCVTLPASHIAKVKEALSKVAFGPKKKIKFDVCIHKMFEGVSNQQAIRIPQSTVYYIPQRLQALFMDIVIKLREQEPGGSEHTELLAVPLLACVQPAVRHLSQKSLTTVHQTQQDMTSELVFPYLVTKLMAKSSQHVDYFCNHVNIV